MNYWKSRSINGEEWFLITTDNDYGLLMEQQEQTYFTHLKGGSSLNIQQPASPGFPPHQTEEHIVISHPGSW